MLNKIFLEQDGLVVGGNQLTTQGGSVSVGNNIYVGANTVTSNLTVTGTFNYPKANTSLPAFSAFGNALVSAPNTTNTQIAYNQVEFDTNSCFNPTNQWLYVNGIYTPPWSFAPNIPGYYQINATIFGTQSGTSNAFIQAVLYKQNASYKYAITPFGGAGITVTVSTVVFMNGISDYLSVYGYQNTGGALNIGSSTIQQSFNGCFLRPA